MSERASEQISLVRAMRNEQLSECTNEWLDFLRFAYQKPPVDSSSAREQCSSEQANEWLGERRNEWPNTPSVDFIVILPNVNWCEKRKGVAKMMKKWQASNDKGSSKKDEEREK